MTKAAGLDGIPTRFFKDNAAVLAPTVTFLVNLSPSIGSVPDERKKDRVVPQYKPGGRENMDNKRPCNLHTASVIKSSGEDCKLPLNFYYPFKFYLNGQVGNL